MKREADQSASKQAVWELTSTDHVLAGKIREALRSVEDPELGYNVIELGLIRNTARTENSLNVTMILTTPFCPYAGELVEAVRATVTEVSGLQVFVDLRFDPWDPAMMEDGMDFDWGLY